ncbi:hypothetical protein EG329_008146 [Mollisiaceae sp. DMI_Dod_QoI]|nr:hypothetical protein EG329_008146 [Helotiales sp. DMI_Dod_QoI]
MKGLVRFDCDEAKPECENCVKHSLICEYSPGQPTFHTHATSPAVGGVADLNLFDLELLHHFCTSTALSLHDNSTVRTLWSTNVPKLGFEYDYVMHGILAFSALHLAHLCLEKRADYTARARLHHHAGLQKGTPALATFSDENASPIYMFSALTTLYSIAHIGDASILSSEEGVAEWIVLCRQSYGIVRIAEDVVKNGPVGQIFKVGARRIELQDQFTTDNFPGAQFLQEFSTFIGETIENVRIKDAYTSAISQLIKSFGVVSVLPPSALESSDVFGWPFRVSDDFLELLQELRQEALVILAFFAVLTRRLDSKWWLQGFGDHLMTMIYRLLDEDHKSWISWPNKEMNWKPEEVNMTISQLVSGFQCCQSVKG